MDIAVLGPIELRAGTGTTVPVAGALLRTLLVLLALDAGRAVSVDRLVDGVWGADPPRNAAGALQALVSRLRRAAPDLAIAVGLPAGAGPGPGRRALGEPERAAMLLGAADAVRGAPDRSMPDIPRITPLGHAGFLLAFRSGGSVTMATALRATGLQDP